MIHRLRIYTVCWAKCKFGHMHGLNAYYSGMVQEKNPVRDSRRLHNLILDRWFAGKLG